MDKQTGKFIARIAENLPDMSSGVMQGWIDNPKALKKFLRGLSPPPTPSITFEIWKTLKLGTGLRTADEFRLAIKGVGYQISDLASDILGKSAFTVATEEIELNLVNVSVAELGFANGATRREIYRKVFELGLELCPAEVGPQLCLQYKDQSMSELFFIGMEPIARSDDGSALGIFSVEPYQGDLWLFSNNGHPDFQWTTVSRWLFVRPRN